MFVQTGWGGGHRGGEEVLWGDENVLHFVSVGAAKGRHLRAKLKQVGNIIIYCLLSYYKLCLNKVYFKRKKTKKSGDRYYVAFLCRGTINT